MARRLRGLQGLAASALAGLALSCGPGAKSPDHPSAPAAASSAAPLVKTRPGGRLPEGVIPKRYVVNLSIDPQKRDFAGRVAIELQLERPTRALVLHGQHLTLHKAELRQGATTVPAIPKSRPASAQGTAPDEIVLRLQAQAAAGRAWLHIEHSGQVRTSGRGLIRVEQDGTPYVFSHFEPAAARRAFPCFDEPRFKAPVELSLTVPAGNVAVANAPMKRQFATAGGRSVTYEFEATPPLPTYLVALAVGSFDQVQGGEQSVVVRVLSSPGNAKRSRVALGTARRQLGSAVRYLGQPYPFAKLDLLGVPKLPFGVAMEHPGLVTVSEDFLLVDERSSSWSRAGHERVIAHELAHMWFGNLVTMAWWDDVWLNEGLATWMEGKICDLANPDCSGEAANAGYKAHVMRLDSLPTAKPVRRRVNRTADAESSFDELTYFKGMSVIRMAEHWLGEATLLAGLQEYLQQGRWRSVTTADLARALGSASGADVAPVLDSFINQTGIPLATLRLDCSPTEQAPPLPPKLQIEQRPYAVLGQAGTSKKRWSLPVCVRFDAGEGTRQQCSVVRGPEGELTLQATRCPQWLYPNAHDGGYYHFVVAPDWLSALASQNHKLTEPERIGMLANLWALVRGGQLGADTYLGLLRHFANEESPVAWWQILEGLSQLQRMLPRQTRPAFARYVRDLVGPPARRLGWTIDPGDTGDRRMLRARLLWVLGGLGQDEWARKQAAPLAECWVEDHQSVHVDVASAAVPLHASTGTWRLFDRLLSVLRYSTSPDERQVALLALTSFDDPEFVRRLLDLALTKKLSTAQARSVLRLLFERAKRRDVAYEWIQLNLSRATKQQSPLVEQLVWIIPKLCRAESVRHATRFFQSRVEGLPKVKEALRQATEAGNRCAKLASHQAPLVERFLRAERQPR